MSDEEDTANLLVSEQITTENEPQPPQPNRLPNTNKYVNPKTICTIQNVVGLISIFTSGLSFGYDLSIISNVIRPIAFTWDLDCKQQFYIITVWILGAIASSIFGGFIIDFFGRKYTIIFSTLLLALSSILLCTLNSYTDLLFSRSISGFGGPLLSISQLIYIAETSHHNVRGFRMTLHFVGASLGSLIAFLVGLNVPIDDYTWRLAQAFTVVPVLMTLMITLIWLPKSPHFVLYRTMHESVKKTNMRFVVLAEMVFVCLLLVVLKKLLGTYTVFFYAPQLFTMLGMCAMQTSLAVVVTSLVKFLSTCLCLHIVDQLNRRVILITSSTILMVSIALLSLISSLNGSEQSFSPLDYENCNRLVITEADGITIVRKTDVWYSSNETKILNEDPPPYPMLPTPLSLVGSNLNSCGVETSGTIKLSTIIGVVLLFLYEAAYTFGLGTVTWLLICELFPTSIRGRGICILNLLHWLSDVVLPTNFLQTEPKFEVTFLIFSFVAMLSIFLIYLFVPETKTKSLHQIAQEVHNISMFTRIFQNLYALPFFNNSQWLEHRTRQYRRQNRVTERTVI